MKLIGLFLITFMLLSCSEKLGGIKKEDLVDTWTIKISSNLNFTTTYKFTEEGEFYCPSYAYNGKYSLVGSYLVSPKGEVLINIPASGNFKLNGPLIGEVYKTGSIDKIRIKWFAVLGNGEREARGKVKEAKRGY